MRTAAKYQYGGHCWTSNDASVDNFKPYEKANGRKRASFFQAKLPFRYTAAVALYALNIVNKVFNFFHQVNVLVMSIWSFNTEVKL